MLAIVVLGLFLPQAASVADAAPSRATGSGPLYLSPAALAVSADGRNIFVACATADRVLVLDAVAGQITRSIPVPSSPTGLALSPDGRQVFVTCAAPRSTVCILDAASLKVLKRVPAGHTAVAPVCSPDAATLYTCDRFDNCIRVIDLKAQRELARVPVQREPVSAALTPDGRFLFVANHLHAGRADADEVAACVSVIDTIARKVVREIALPNGSTMLRDTAISPDGSYACVAQVIGQFHLPTTQIERGWIANNALSVLDVRNQRLLGTVLLDNIDNGAANPWAVAWTADGRQICVSHAGTHELSIIDAPALLKKLAAPPSPPTQDLTFLVGLRQRIRLNQKGPRSLVLIGSKAYLGNYFSDSLSVVDLSAPDMPARSIALGPPPQMSAERQGELAFNDASLCFQGWQSCATCHSSDARVDGLNWDLLNDGIGNPKNVKSLLFAHKTPPTMALGVRENARLAVRAGFRYILFTVPPEETAEAVDVYLESLTPVPSPLRQNGKLSRAAARGKKLFSDEQVGCAKCHNGDLYTDLKPYDVGSSGRFDKPEDRFYTPPLIEVWRTAPYMHDGSAATMRDVLTTANHNDQHGKTSHLTKRQLEDLAAFVLSL